MQKAFKLVDQAWKKYAMVGMGTVRGTSPVWAVLQAPRGDATVGALVTVFMTTARDGSTPMYVDPLSIYLLLYSYPLFIYLFGSYCIRIHIPLWFRDVPRPHCCGPLEYVGNLEAAYSAGEPFLTMCLSPKLL